MANRTLEYEVDELGYYHATVCPTAPYCAGWHGLPGTERIVWCNLNESPRVDAD